MPTWRRRARASRAVIRGERTRGSRDMTAATVSWAAGAVYRMLFFIMGISSLSSKSGRAGGQRQGGPVDSSRAGKPGQAGKEGGRRRLPPLQADPPARLPRPAPWTRRVWGHIRLPGPRLPLSMELTSLCFDLEGPGKRETREAAAAVSRVFVLSKHMGRRPSFSITGR